MNVKEDGDCGLASKQTPKVLLITWNYPPKLGGMELMLCRLVKHSEPQLFIGVFGPNGGSLEDDPELQIIARARSKKLSTFFLESFAVCLGLLRNGNYDVIVAGSALMAPVVVTLGRLCQKATAVHVYGLDLIYPNKLYQWLVRRFVPRADLVVAISQASKSEAIRRGVEPSRVATVNPGVDYGRFSVPRSLDSTRVQYQLLGHRVLLTVGRLARRKGVLDFVRNVLPMIIETHPDVLYVVVGENPTDSLAHNIDMRQEIASVVSTLGLEKHVRLLGHVSDDDLPLLYQCSNVFVLPAIETSGDIEGFGIVLIEASAAGLPVVATRVGGIMDAVADGQSGFLVKPGDWQALADTTRHLLDRNDVSENVGKRGQERARSFDWATIGQQYAALIKTLAG